MTELSYQSIRTANQAREADEVRTDSRKKNLLILVLHYLNEEGYLDSSQSLARETNIDLSRYEVCDNIDLETILMEYESYYYVKFAKYPKLTKKLTQSGLPGIKTGDRGRLLPGKNTRANSTLSSKTRCSSRGLGQTKIPLTSRPPSPPPAGRHERPQSGRGRRAITSSTRKPSAAVSVSGPAMNKDGQAVNGHAEGLSLQGMTVHGAQGAIQNSENPSEPVQKPRRQFGQIIDVRAMLNEATRMAAEEGVSNDDRMLKPLGGYMGYSSEWRDLAQTISRDIYLQNPNVRWDDIIGLDEAKRLMKESVVYPVKYPQLFQGILSPWKGVLLYGPPGTGKTLLAKAVATECNTTFFNISASTIVSKWRGDSEKLVRVLFELARFHAPSTIFLDELESLMSQRGSQGGSTEHEGSRRMKTELLVQMDGLAKTDDLVFLLAASNLPWELDHAMLRRLEKRILVDLPTFEARRAMFLHHLPPVVCSKDGGLELLSDLDYDMLGVKTEGYSGSDIKLVSKEAAMRPVRKIFVALENHTEGEELHIKLDTIRTHDVLAAIERTKPSAKLLKDKYSRWQREYESV
ncbi:katanin p60 ATPase-containing subunit A-like 2 isoform X3 [Babylonia areolata]|uniref:katanin p60 ATPase-containing subunit A-like 2 isoform X3 n=1 Tax=Babylonia areolata TaxID=304850 RepID=UPI003FD56834